MANTPAKFTLVDLRRATKAAAEAGMRVRVAPTGDIILEPVPPQPSFAGATVDTEKTEWAM